MLRNVYGWSKNSDEPSTYIHLSGEAVKKALLQKAGVQQKAETEPKVVMCPRCKCPNEPNATLCVKCKSVLRLQDALSISNVEKKLEGQDKVIKELQAQISRLTSTLGMIPGGFGPAKPTETSKMPTRQIKNLKDAGLIVEKQSS